MSMGYYPEALINKHMKTLEARKGLKRRDLLSEKLEIQRNRILLREKEAQEKKNMTGEEKAARDKYIQEMLSWDA